MGIVGWAPGASDSVLPCWRGQRRREGRTIINREERLSQEEKEELSGGRSTQEDESAKGGEVRSQGEVR